MIAQLTGRILHHEPGYIILDVNGVGYQVQISLSTYSSVKGKETLTLHTVLVVREDAHLLYGFASPDEKQMFQHLTSVNGVGPGTAIMVLSSLNPAQLREAIQCDDVRTLQAVKGIGAKTAQRLILELKDKIGSNLQHGSAGNAGGNNLLRGEALSALTTLGINRAVAEKTIDAILKRSGNAISLEELVKLALKTA